MTTRLTFREKLSNLTRDKLNELRYRIQYLWYQLSFRLNCPKGGDLSGGRVFLFCVFKNESLRLDYFLKYYKSMGVDYFFFVDHGSTDRSREIIEAHDRTFIFPVRGRLRWKPIWIQVLLDRFANGRWCVVVDVDELLVLPVFFDGDLKRLGKHLDNVGSNCLPSKLVDMYPKGLLSEVNYQSGEDPLKWADHFDRDLKVRNRVFGANPCLDKVPFHKNSRTSRLGYGQHHLYGGNPSRSCGAVLHFKFLQDFTIEKINIRLVEAERNTDHNSFAVDENEAYRSSLAGEGLVLSYGNSLLYQGPSQLEQLGVVVGPKVQKEKLLNQR